MISPDFLYMKRSKSNTRGRPDFYARQAKKDNFPARSIYKLEEMQRKYRLIRRGDKVLDLGCAPGSWLLFIAKVTGDKGRVVGIDKKQITIGLPSHVEVHRGDITDMDDELRASVGNGYHAVVSDMAPATTGRKEVDAARSYELCLTALDIAETVLRPGGAFVCKIFQGEDFKAFSEAVRARFDAHKIFKPQSCRKDSSEIYIIGMGKKVEEI